MQDIFGFKDSKSNLEIDKEVALMKGDIINKLQQWYECILQGVSNPSNGLLL